MKNENFLKNVEIKSLDGKNKEENSNSFVFINLPNEFAITLGNYLRRILLSYINGVAIVGVRIGNDNENIKSEFIPIEGVVETPPYLILNLKKIVLKDKKKELHDKDSFKLFINIKNDKDSEYVVTGKDILDFDENIEILNPNIYLATVSPNSSLKIDLYCKKYWGFRKESEQEIFEGDEDVIKIDSNYNPVENVSFKVNLVVVDLDKQEEQLILKINTNGSISPKQALIDALNVSRDINDSLLSKLNLD